MLDGGGDPYCYHSNQYGLYMVAGFNACHHVPACIVGDEVFLAASEVGTDTQVDYRYCVSVPLFLAIFYYILHY